MSSIKISELTPTTSLSNNDLLVVTKNPSSTPVSNSITVSNLGVVLTPLTQNAIPNTTVTTGSVSVASNGTSLVPWYTYTIPSGKTGCSEIRFHARDVTANGNQAYSTGHIHLAANSSSANLAVTITQIGGNPIIMENSPTVSSNTITLYFRRNSVATTNVEIRYLATIY